MATARELPELHRRPFGTTGLEVTVPGLGAGQVGDGALTEAEAERLLRGTLDAGVNLIDTARGYGLSEERIGRHLADRRGELVLSTKVGYDIPGHADWTAQAVALGVDEALRRLRTDYLDIVHLHSCALEVLERGAVIDALEEARAAGKVRLVAYSGENEALDYAVACGRFAGIETSVNVYDQRGIDGPVARAAALGLGVIAKRPSGNAPWRFATRPVGAYAEDYWLRGRAMDLDPGELSWQELALRFTATVPGVSTMIVGTSRLAHLHENIAVLAAGALPPAEYERVRNAFREHDDGWVGLV